MATQRERYAVQFQVTEDDLPEAGVIASLNALQIQGLEAALSMSDNLFLRKAGRAMIALQDSALSKELVTEKLTLEQEIADTLATLAMDRESSDKENASARATLVKAKFPQAQVDTMINGLVSVQEADFEAVRGQVAEMQARITAIELTPVREVNSSFLDGFAKVSVPSTGNGSRAINGEIHIAKFDQGNMTISVTTPNDWRLYGSDDKEVLASAQVPGVLVSSRTKARKLAYCWRHKTAFGPAETPATIEKVHWPSVNAGGVGANGELIEKVDNFVPA